MHPSCKWNHEYEYDPKEVVKSFIDLVNMAKGLLDENQQPSVQQELKKLFLRTRGRELHRVGADKSSASTVDTNASFAASSTTKWTVAEMCGSKTCGDSQ